MRKNAEKVIAAFNAGEYCNEKTIRTDGSTVWSYALPIARFEPDGSLWILPYNYAPTVTTKSHVRALQTAIRTRMLQCKHEDCRALLASDDIPVPCLK